MNWEMNVSFAVELDGFSSLISSSTNQSFRALNYY